MKSYFLEMVQGHVTFWFVYAPDEYLVRFFFVEQKSSAIQFSNESYLYQDSKKSRQTTRLTTKCTRIQDAENVSIQLSLQTYCESIGYLLFLTPPKPLITTQNIV